jgi:hypothetical protein
VRDALRDLDPAYFGLVMSTGIVAVAFRELGIAAVAWPLAALTPTRYSATSSIGSPPSSSEADTENL